MKNAIRRYRFYRAYMTLRKVADRHRAMGHSVEFKAVNEWYIKLRCLNCQAASWGNDD